MKLHKIAQNYIEAPSDSSRPVYNNRTSLTAPRFVIKSKIEHHTTSTNIYLILRAPYRPIGTSKRTREGIHHRKFFFCIQSMKITTSNVFEFLAKGQNFKNMTNLCIYLDLFKFENIGKALKRVIYYLLGLPALKKFRIICSASKYSANTEIKPQIFKLFGQMINISPFLNSFGISLTKLSFLTQAHISSLAKSIHRAKELNCLSIKLPRAISMKVEQLKQLFIIEDRKFNIHKIDLTHEDGYEDFDNTMDNLFEYSSGIVSLNNNWKGRVGDLDNSQFVSMLNKLSKCKTVKFTISYYDYLSIESQNDSELKNGNTEKLTIATLKSEVNKAIINFFYETISTLTKLQILEIDFTSVPKFHDKQLVTLGESLLNLKSLKKFHFSCNDTTNVTDKGVEALTYSVSRLLLLEDLDLNFGLTGIDAVCIQIVLRGIMTLTKLKYLALDFGGYVNASNLMVECFVNPFKFMPNLDCLKIVVDFNIEILENTVNISLHRYANNRISDFEILLYTSAQKAFWMIRVLNLRLEDCSDLTGDGIDLLFDHIQNHKILNDLRIKINNNTFVDDKKLEKLLNWISKLSFLESIQLCFVNSENITDKSINSLAIILADLKYLKCVDLNFSQCYKISLGAVEKLINILKAKNLFQNVEFYNTKILNSQNHLDIECLNLTKAYEDDISFLQFFLKDSALKLVSIKVSTDCRYFTRERCLALSSSIKNCKSFKFTCCCSSLEINNKEIKANSRFVDDKIEKIRIDNLLYLAPEQENTTFLSVKTSRHIKINDDAFDGICEFIDHYAKLQKFRFDFEGCRLKASQTQKLVERIEKTFDKKSFSPFSFRFCNFEISLDPLIFICKKINSESYLLFGDEELLAISHFFALCPKVQTVDIKLTNFICSSDFYSEFFEDLSKLPCLKNLTFNNSVAVILSSEKLQSLGKCIRSMKLEKYDLDLGYLNFSRKNKEFFLKYIYHPNIISSPVVDYTFQCLSSSKELDIFANIESVNIEINKAPTKDEDKHSIPSFIAKFSDLKFLTLYCPQFLENSELVEILKEYLIKSQHLTEKIEISDDYTHVQPELGDTVIRSYLELLNMSPSLMKVTLNAGGTTLHLQKIPHLVLFIHNQAVINPKTFESIMVNLKAIKNLDRLLIDSFSGANHAFSQLGSVLRSDSQTKVLRLKFIPKMFDRNECSNLITSIKNLQHLEELDLTFNFVSDVDELIIKSINTLLKSLVNLTSLILDFRGSSLINNKDIHALLSSVWHSASLIYVKINLNSISSITEDITIFENKMNCKKEFKEFEIYIKNFNVHYKRPKLIVERNSLTPQNEFSLSFASFIFSIVPNFSDLEICLAKGSHPDQTKLEPLLTALQRLNSLESLQLMIDDYEFKDDNLDSVFEIVKSNPKLNSLIISTNFCAIDKLRITNIIKEIEDRVKDCILNLH